MKVFLDTNVLIDYLLKREEGETAAVEILLLGNSRALELFVSDLTIANAAYIVRKDYEISEFRRALRVLAQCYSVASIGEHAVNQALLADWKDFEDSLQYYAAVDAGCECIVTRNIKDFSESEIPVYSPTEFLSVLQK